MYNTVKISALFLLLASMMGCKQTKNDSSASEQKDDKVNLRQETDFGQLYQYYIANPTTLEQKDQNAIIEYAADQNLNCIKSVSGVFICNLERTQSDSLKWGQKISVHYKGYFLDGGEFDSSYKRNKPLEFRIGSMIPGFNEGLLYLSAGSKATLIIPSHLGYGKKGFGELVGPDKILVFDVDVLSD